MPRLRMSFPLGWTSAGHSATVLTHFISGYTNDDPEARVSQAISPWATLDLQYGYKLDEGDGVATTFTAGVTNVFDTDPPKLDAGYGYDVFVHDPRGRVIYGRLTQEF
jgi:outer membrane receptor protein involved in Fe transport